MHAMVTHFTTERPVSASDVEQADPAAELLIRVNEFLAKGRWSPEFVRVQVMVLPLGRNREADVHILVTHPAPSD